MHVQNFKTLTQLQLHEKDIERTQNFMVRTDSRITDTHTDTQRPTPTDNTASFRRELQYPRFETVGYKNAELLWDQNVHVQIRRSTAKTRYKQFEVPTSSLALRSVVIYDFKTWYSSFVVLFCHVLNALKQMRRQDRQRINGSFNLIFRCSEAPL